MEYCQATDLHWCFIVLKQEFVTKLLERRKNFNDNQMRLRVYIFSITLSFTFTSKDERETWRKLKPSLLYMAQKPSSDKTEGTSEFQSWQGI